MIEYDKFKKSLALLQEQNERFNSLSDDQEEWVVVAVKESIVQRFETCWDCLWKVLKRYLEEEVGLAEVPNGPKPILRLINENHLLPSDISEWLKYNKARINTSHDYSGEKADDAVEIINDFVDDAIALYQTISGESWE
ncbi:MAG: nucleotidyltransferase substrate binding protein [SAR324 cluster bacterium]|nr:nucleotidyltransferase substrate binding protein [SAR324 cluster bacterium]